MTKQYPDERSPISCWIYDLLYSAYQLSFYGTHVMVDRKFKDKQYRLYTSPKWEEHYIIDKGKEIKLPLLRTEPDVEMAYRFLKSTFAYYDEIE